MKHTKLSKLPHDAKLLVTMGLYTLYRVVLSGHPEVKYVLRIDDKLAFLLKEDGSVAEYDSITLTKMHEIGVTWIEKIEFTDIQAPLMVNVSEYF